MNVNQPRVILPIFNPFDFLPTTTTVNLQPTIDSLNSTIVTLNNAIQYVGFAQTFTLWNGVSLPANGTQTIPNLYSSNSLNFGWFAIDSNSTGGAYIWSVQGSSIASVIGNNVNAQLTSVNTDFFTGVPNSNLVISNNTGSGINLNDQGTVFNCYYLITLL